MYEVAVHLLAFKYLSEAASRNKVGATEGFDESLNSLHKALNEVYKPDYIINHTGIIEQDTK